MNAILAPTAPSTLTHPLSPEREAEIRATRYADRSLAAADIDIDDLLAEIDRLRTERHSTNDTLADLTVTHRTSEARVAHLTALLEQARSEARTAIAEAGA